MRTALEESHQDKADAKALAQTKSADNATKKSKYEEEKKEENNLETSQKAKIANVFQKKIEEITYSDLKNCKNSKLPLDLHDRRDENCFLPEDTKLFNDHDRRNKKNSRFIDCT